MFLLLLLLLCRQAGAYPDFRSMKRLGVFLLPPGWNVSSLQGYQTGAYLDFRSMKRLGVFLLPPG